MDFWDRLKEAGGNAIDAAVREGLNSVGILGTQAPSQANPTPQQVLEGQLAISPNRTIEQREGTEGLKNSLYQYYQDNSMLMTVLIGIVAVTVGLLIWKRR